MIFDPFCAELACQYNAAIRRELCGTNLTWQMKVGWRLEDIWKYPKTQVTASLTSKCHEFHVLSLVLVFDTCIILYPLVISCHIRDLKSLPRRSTKHFSLFCWKAHWSMGFQISSLWSTLMARDFAQKIAQANCFSASKRTMHAFAPQKRCLNHQWHEWHRRIFVSSSHLNHHCSALSALLPW